MNDIETQVDALAKRAVSAENAGAAMQFAQAALNLANAAATLSNMKKIDK